MNELLLGSILVVMVLVVVVQILIYRRPHPEFPVIKFPESKVISQTAVVKSDADITTVLPVPLGAATCNHDWEVLTDTTLEMSHEKKYVLVVACRRCGVLDKTIATTSKPPKSPDDCHHRWGEEKSVRLESAFEQMADAKNFDMKKLDLEDLPREFFRKTYTKVYKCEDCGVIQVVQASNLEAVPVVEVKDD